MDEKVLYDDLTFEITTEHETYDEEFFTLNGKLFTGVAEETDNDGNHSITRIYQFENGLLNGMSYGTFDNGLPSDETFYKNGRIVSYRNWYYNGMLEEVHREDPEYIQLFNINGVIICDKTEYHYNEWYDDGAIKVSHRYIDNYAVRFAPNGKPLLKHLSNGDSYLTMDKAFIQFNNENMKEYSLTTLEKDYLYFYQYFKIWIDSIEDLTYLTEIVCKMIISDNLEIKFNGMNFAANYMLQVTIPILQEQLNDKRHIETINHKTSLSVAQEACWTIKKIKGEL